MADKLTIYEHGRLVREDGAWPDSLKGAVEMLPVEQWKVNINKDGNAEVCISHLNMTRYWHLVENVTRQEN